MKSAQTHSQTFTIVYKKDIKIGLFNYYLKVLILQEICKFVKLG
jgi:hypothetical protein